MPKRIYLHLTAILFVFIFGYILTIPRENFIELVSCYSLIFLTFLIIVRSNYPFKIHLFVLCSILALFFLPNLSEDYFRFLWDGELVHLGINPFDYKPKEIIGELQGNKLMTEIFANMTELSRQNYSCYPPVNQLYFIISTVFKNDIYGSMLLMKIFVSITHFFGLIYGIKLFRNLNLNDKLIWFVFINPLFLIETAGNIHFEGVTLSFMIIALYFLQIKKWPWFIIFITLAIQIKLLPLIILPFLLRLVGWKKSISMGLAVLGLLLIFSFTMLNTYNLPHFFESLKLYFGAFEFNSALIHYIDVKEHAKWGFHRLVDLSKILSRYSLLIILGIAFYGGEITFETFLKRIYVALIIYFLLTATLHPWYLLTPLFFGIAVRSFFALTWTFFTFFSYSYYSEDAHGYFNVFRFMCYSVVIIIGLIEIVYYYRNKKTLFDLTFALQ